MTIKEVFEKAENGTLTFEQFTELSKDSKFADLSLGEYVSKQKHDSELEAKDKQIKTLNDTISTRNTDLETLKKQLEEAGTDADKLNELNSQFADLKGRYEADTKAYKEQLKKQAYDFAVKDFANTKEFSSSAAKRDFIEQLKRAELKMDGDKILGADDFTAKYQAENADAFVVKKDPEPAPTADPKPKFVEPTGTPPAGKKFSLSELMRMKNENPDASITL